MYQYKSKDNVLKIKFNISTINKGGVIMEKEYYVVNDSIVDVNEKTVIQYGLRTKKTNVSHVK